MHKRIAAKGIWEACCHERYSKIVLWPFWGSYTVQNLSFILTCNSCLAELGMISVLSLIQFSVSSHCSYDLDFHLRSYTGAWRPVIDTEHR